MIFSRLRGLLMVCALGAVWPLAALAGGHDTALPPRVSLALAQAGVPEGALAVLVAPLAPQRLPVLRHRAHMAVSPASVIKLVTTYAALDMLGPHFTWRTQFYSDGPISQGVLRGNLYVRGGGDPKLVHERIRDIFAHLRALGVRVILGDMVLDRSAFDLPQTSAAAFDDQPLRPYNATPDALLVNFKSLSLQFEPDPARGVARVTTQPPLVGLRVDAALPLSDQSCTDWRAKLQARFDDPNAIRFEGGYPRSCAAQDWNVAYQDPSSYAARTLQGLWYDTGGALTGTVRSGQTPPRARLLHEAHSLPLAELIKDVNQWSNNVMAQQMFLTLGRVRPLHAGQASPADSLAAFAASAAAGQPVVMLHAAQFERSRHVLAQWWQRRLGMREQAPVLDNGAGLSRHERISPDALVALLRHAAAHPHAASFVQSLAQAGVSGTAASMTNPAIATRAWLKTGTLRDVAGIAGYVDARNGTRYAVAAFINHPNAPAARPALQALLEWTAELP